MRKDRRRRDRPGCGPAGPGSFTGVRIGVSAAKGFAWGADLPCYGVSTLEAMARSLGVYQGYVLGVMDARRSQVYAGLFHADCGKYTRVMEDSAISLEEFNGSSTKMLRTDFSGLATGVFCAIIRC